MNKARVLLFVMAILTLVVATFTYGAKRRTAYAFYCTDLMGKPCLNQVKLFSTTSINGVITYCSTLPNSSSCAIKLVPDAN